MELPQLPSLPRLYLGALAGVPRELLRGVKAGSADKLDKVGHADKVDPADKLDGSAPGPTSGGVSADLAHSGAPEHAWRVRGVKISQGNLDAFNELFGLTRSEWVPSAYVHTVVFPLAVSVMSSEEFPFPLMGLIHLSNRVRQPEKISVGAIVDVAVWPENFRPHPRGTQVDIRTQISESGQLIWAESSTYLAKRGNGGGKPVARQSSRAAFTPPLPTAIWRLDAGTGRRYGKVSGDINPIHLSSLSARLLGMKSAVAHGMYSVTRALCESGRLDSIELVYGPVDWSVHFEAPVVLPGKVQLAYSLGHDRHGEYRAFTAWNSRGRQTFYGQIHPL